MLKHKWEVIIYFRFQQNKFFKEKKLKNKMEPTHLLLLLLQMWVETNQKMKKMKKEILTWTKKEDDKVSLKERWKDLKIIWNTNEGYLQSWDSLHYAWLWRYRLGMKKLWKILESILSSKFSVPCNPKHGWILVKLLLPVKVSR